MTREHHEWWCWIDWRKPDSLIAEEVKRSRQAVNSTRKRHGKPNPYRRAINAYTLTQLPLEHPTARDVALALGVSEESAHDIAKRAGVTLERPPRPTKYDWRTVDWSLTNTEIVTALGMPPTIGSQNRVSGMRSRYAPGTLRASAPARAAHERRNALAALRAATVTHPELALTLTGRAPLDSWYPFGPGGGVTQTTGKPAR